MISIVTRAYDRVRGAMGTLSPREQVPLALFLGAVGCVVLLVGHVLGDTTGVTGFTAKRIAAVCFTVTILGTAAVLDLWVGKRHVVAWLKAAAADLGGIVKFIGMLAELALLVAIAREFAIGNAAFTQVIFTLTFVGFVIKYFLPRAYRLPFFVLLSVVGIWAVLGLKAAVWVIGICLAMIGICHLPLAYKWRIASLLLASGVLAACRAGYVHGPWPTIIWPIVGSLLMFRLIVYVYDIRHSKDPGSISATLSYFFLLPNVVFPLFPVVDYRTFRRTTYDAEEFEIYQRGMQWILRGVTQLILYRLVYNYFTLPTTQVANVGQLARFLFANFALYLNVSGSFHLIVGILHLFGFHLPETNHRYFLSSSFNDFWRRINIYWRDFMMKVFYYPAYFRLRKFGNTTALVLSTLFIFFVTWVLHAYQWFWLRGSFIVSRQDDLFWSILGVLVVINALYEMKYGRQRKLGKMKWNLSTVTPLALRTAGTMTLICIVWSLWTSMSISDWLALWYLPGKKASAALSLLGLLTVGMAAGGIAEVKAATGKLRVANVKSEQKRPLRDSIIIVLSYSILLYLVGRPAVYSRLGSRAMGTIRTLRSDNLNAQDAALVQKGYYEDLKVERFDSQLWDIYMKRPTDWQPIGETEAALKTGDLRWIELRPLMALDLKGAPFHTNRWGMRDSDYSKDKQPGTYRYAMVGASISMGSGVADDQTFKAILETRLNRENVEYRRYSKYEVLNFSVGGYSPIQYLWVVEHKIDDFHPDALLYIAHGNHDEERTIFFLSKFVRAGVDLQYNYLKDIVREAGVDRNTPEGVAEKRLQPYARPILSWVYQRIVADCQQKNIVPIWVYLQTLEEWQMPKASASTHLQLAKAAGFVTLDLSHWYGTYSVRSLQIAAWDAHPNALGQRMIADRLYDALRISSRSSPFGFPGGMADKESTKTTTVRSVTAKRP